MNDYRTNAADACHDFTASQWEAVRDEVSNLVSLGANWDGEGALPARPGLVEATLRLLQTLEPCNRAPADAYLAPDGTVVLEWHYPEGHATIVNVRVTDRAEVMDRAPGRPPQFDILPIPEPWGRVERATTGPVSYLDDGAYELAA